MTARALLALAGVALGVALGMAVVAASPAPAAAADPTPSPTPVVRPIGPALANEGFEVVGGEELPGWSKQGGVLKAGGPAYSGERGAFLTSATDSTKWLYQAVTVEGGEWYEASAWARVVAGEGEAFLRIAWYVSGDGSGRQRATVSGEGTSGRAWAAIAVGPVQAPPEARSAVVRLMFRPASGSEATAAFDDVSFAVGEAPTPAPTPTPAATATPTPAATATATPTPTPTATAPQAPLATPAPAPTPAPRVTPAPVAVVTATAVPVVLGLRLSEVLADPVEPGVDRAFEWVELVNTAAVVVSTEGWSIGDGSSVDALPGVEMPPGGFVVVAAARAVLPVNVLVVRVPDGAIGNGLNNSGDVVRLIARGGEVVDALSFGENGTVFPSPPPAAGAARTLGARDYEGEAASGRWAETLRPSPGGPNTFAAPAAAPVAVASPAASRLEGGRTPALVSEETAGGGAVASGEATSSLRPLPVRFERESGARTPWIVLGAISGASAVLLPAALWGVWDARGRRGA